MPEPTFDDRAERVVRWLVALAFLFAGAAVWWPAGAARIKAVAAIAGVQLKNVAAVMVTATLPPSAPPGQPVDVNVSSIGNAKSLRGGTLVATPMKGLDGQIYAIAQGNLVIGGAGAAAGGSKVVINQLSSGRVPAGATVERSVPSAALQGDALQLAMNAVDFQTARAVAQAINRAKGEGTATPIDGRVVQVSLPPDHGRRVAFVADIDNRPLALAKPAA